MAGAEAHGPADESTSDQLVDRAHQFFTKAEDALLLSPKITDGAKLTYLVLRRHAFHGGETVYPTISRLARLRSCSTAKIDRHIRELRDAGLIERERRTRGVSITYLEDPDLLDLEPVAWAEGHLIRDVAEPGDTSELTCRDTSDLTHGKRERRKRASPPPSDLKSGRSEDRRARKRKQKRKKTTRPASPEGASRPSDYDRFVKWLCEDRLPKAGIPYTFAGGRDAKLVSRLLETHGYDRLVRLVGMSLRDDWLVAERGWSLQTFFDKSNEYSSRLAARERDERPPKKRRQPKQQIDFTMSCSRHPTWETCEVCLGKWEAYRAAQKS